MKSINLKLTADQAELARKAGCEFHEASEAQVRRLSMQQRIFWLDGKAFVVNRGDGFLQTSGTLSQLLAQAASMPAAAPAPAASVPETPEQVDTAPPAPSPPAPQRRDTEVGRHQHGRSRTNEVVVTGVTVTPPSLPTSAARETPPDEILQGQSADRSLLNSLLRSLAAVTGGWPPTKPPAAVTASSDDLLALTAGIVAAHACHNPMPAGQVPEMIGAVYQALSDAGNPTVAEPQLAPQRPEPAVPVKKSITPDFLVCLEDGRQLRMLKRYLLTRYRLTPDAYRQRWNLPADYPMVAPAYANKRSQLARQTGLGRKRRKASTPLSS